MFSKARFVTRLPRKSYSLESKIPRKIFSGIQPTGTVHLGNYIGAIRQWKRLQDNNEDVILSVVDLHSITLPQKPAELSNNIFEMTATILACGIEPEKTILFQQSAVPQHTELCWQLGCISTMARLAHLPQYKEKSSNLKDIPLGLLIYPVLQAADILLYKATHVPVGEDQLQHLQLCQELARMFNSRFGETFNVPHAILLEPGLARLKNLRDPTKKMSKSEPNTKSRICLLDSDDEIRMKMKKALTDFTSQVTYDVESRPGISNLINIHSAVTGKSPELICGEVSHLNTGQYKLYVADALIEHISPIRRKITELMDDKFYLQDVLNNGRTKAVEIAEETVQHVRMQMGLRPKKSLENRQVLMK